MTDNLPKRHLEEVCMCFTEEDNCIEEKARLDERQKLIEEIERALRPVVIRNDGKATAYALYAKDWERFKGERRRCKMTEGISAHVMCQKHLQEQIKEEDMYTGCWICINQREARKEFAARLLNMWRIHGSDFVKGYLEHIKKKEANP